MALGPVYPDIPAAKGQGAAGDDWPGVRQFCELSLNPFALGFCLFVSLGEAGSLRQAKHHPAIALIDAQAERPGAGMAFYR